jgi:hypothetical protein
VARLLLLSIKDDIRWRIKDGEQMKYLISIIMTALVLGLIYVGMWIGCALDDECFEMHTNLSAKDPRYAKPE